MAYQQSSPMLGGGGQFPPGPPPGGYSNDAGGYPQQDAFGTNPPGGQSNPHEPGAPGNAMNRPTPLLNIFFFAAACCIIINAFLAGVALFFNGSLVDFMNLTYIMLFGCAMAINDTPLNLKLFRDLKIYMRKYISLLSRVTGRGVTLLFLATALISAMFSNLNVFFFQFMGVLLNSYVIFVGVAAIVVGWIKSKKLTTCQQHLASGTIENAFPKFAKQYPPTVFHNQAGLTLTEFNTMTKDLAGTSWDESDLMLIFDALVSNPSWRNGSGGDAIKIPLADLQAWVQGGMVLL